MKKLYIIPILVIGCVFFSCKSTPEQEPAIDKAPVEQQAAEEPVAADDFAAKNNQSFEKAEEARTRAVEAQARELLPEIFNSIDTLYQNKKAEIKDSLASKDYSAEIDEFAVRFDALAEAAKACGLKNTIDEYNFAEYDMKNYSEAEKQLRELEDMYNSNSDSAALLDKAKACSESYSKVLTVALKSVAASSRTKALQAKRNADSVYAGVSEKEAYKAAADKIIKADSALVTHDYEPAYRGYLAAEKDFNSLYELVSRKRAYAEEEMEKARLEVENAAAYAEQADEENPLTEESVDGIEDETTVLLETEQYEDPVSSEIDVNDSEVGKEAAALEKLAGQEAQ